MSAVHAADVHSYFVPGQPKMLDLDWEVRVDFKARVLHCTARIAFDKPGHVDLDTRDLKIVEIKVAESCERVGFTMGKPEPIRGSKLSFEVPDVKAVVIMYRTSPKASGLQWLTPKQAGGKHPFLYTQGEAVHARSYLPCQDTPAVKFKFQAYVLAPENLRGLVAANHHVYRIETRENRAGERWHMNYPIPAYLVSLAVGELEYRPSSDRTGVWAQPHLIEQAAKEFGFLPKLMRAGEKLFGPYPFGKYDILFLPMAFPYGGMENPCLTFLTPMLIGMDGAARHRLVGHELAHSWTGNLITNATWRDFWLNEGWTTYAEFRLLEAMEGKNVANLYAFGGRRGLERDFKRWYDLCRPHMTMLVPDLDKMDPDEAFSRIPYIKGATFLAALEKLLGRKRFDKFIAEYIKCFKYKSLTTSQFLRFAAQRLPKGTLEAVRVWDWMYEADMPDNAPALKSPLIDAVAKYGLSNTVPPKQEAKSWLNAQWGIYFEMLKRPVPLAILMRLESRFGLAKDSNPNIRWVFLLAAVESGHGRHFRKDVETLLIYYGNIGIVRTMYGALCKTKSGKKQAKQIFARARGGYHPISAFTAVNAMREAGLAVK